MLSRAAAPGRAKTPKSLGYWMPAEWAPHQATWLSWPHNRESWPGKFERVEPVMLKALEPLADSETVRINVLDEAHEEHVRNLIYSANISGDIIIHRFPTNDAWCRDHGAVFVTGEDGRLAAINWEFNAWGGKYPPWDLDNEIPVRMASALNVPLFDGGMVLEGGSIEVNGAGLLLTTESCLLNPNRNPALGHEQIEQRLCDFLGVRQIVWLGDGIAGDDTDGHIDDITRFVNADTVLTVVENDPTDDNFEPLQRNLRLLSGTTTLDGAKLNVIRLPTPGFVSHGRQRVPASYANFYIANEVVLLPIFNHRNDDYARSALTELFPDRHIVAIDCTDLVWGLGAFHCLTQQVPAV